MSRLKNIKTAYLLGIGGIGMSGIARYLASTGVSVHGYDRTATPLTRTLEKEGMQIHYEINTHKIPAATDIAIYTPAIPADHEELVCIRKAGTDLIKRSEALAEITRDRFTIAVAGTHGKTTVSSILGHILKEAGVNVTAFVGGIMKKYNSNIIFSRPTDVFVVEADEYDRSFLKLHPDIAIITSMDADHLDVYGTRSELIRSFVQFAAGLKKNGRLILSDTIDQDLFGDIRKQTCGLTKTADFRTSEYRIHEHHYMFSATDNLDHYLDNVNFDIPGKYNMENALIASAAAFGYGLDADAVKKGLESYTGVFRRFDYKVKSARHIYIDDYAHHPRELQACISAVKELYPGKKITGIFQPHLYSRTRDFAAAFASSLERLDEIILIPIYPAREDPLPGIGPATILDKMHHPAKMFAEKDAIPGIIRKKMPEVLLTLGAGDIDQLSEPIRKILEEPQ